MGNYRLHRTIWPTTYLPHPLHGIPSAVDYASLVHRVIQDEGTAVVVELRTDEYRCGTLLLLFQGAAGHDAHVLGAANLCADDNLERAN